MAKRKVKHSKIKKMARRKSHAKTTHHRRRKRSTGFSAGAGIMKNPMFGAIAGALLVGVGSKMLGKVSALQNPMLKGAVIAGVGYMLGKKMGNPGISYSMLGGGVVIAFKDKLGMSDNAPYDFVNPNVLSDGDDFSNEFSLSAGNPAFMLSAGDDDFSAPYDNVMLPEFADEFSLSDDDRD